MERDQWIWPLSKFDVHRPQRPRLSQLDAGAPRALFANASALAAGMDRVEGRRRDHERDRQGEQKDRHQRRATPGRQMKINRRREGYSCPSPR